VATIPQRDLRNRVGEMLRRAEAGERLTVTVDGRPVAELGPLSTGRRLPGADALRSLLADAPADAAWARDLASMREQDRASARDPWVEQ